MQKEAAVSSRLRILRVENHARMVRHLMRCKT